jgi:hypothetical protein
MKPIICGLVIPGRHAHIGCCRCAHRIVSISGKPEIEAGHPKSKAFGVPRVASPEAIALGRWLWIPGSRAKVRAPERHAYDSNFEIALIGLVCSFGASQRTVGADRRATPMMPTEFEACRIVATKPQLSTKVPENTIVALTTAMTASPRRANCSQTEKR